MEKNTTPKTEVQFSIKEILGDKLTTKVIVDAIGEWAQYHEGQVAFIGSFVALSKKGDVVDECTIAFGEKKVVKVLMENMEENVEKGKNFVSM